MPELPEVEGFKSYFNRTSTRKKIIDISVKTASLIKKTSATKLRELLQGKSFQKATRKGKFLIIPIAHDPHKLIIHFGMTGSLDYAKQDNLLSEDKKYGQVIFSFKNNHALVWINKRKFGKIYVVKNNNEVNTLKTMGPDALAITKQAFLKLLASKKTKNVKSFLMDQKDIAGIGNEYSNEILFQAGIAPTHSIKSLTASQQAKIYSTMKSVLKKAISLRKIPYKKYPRSWLLAHVKEIRDMKCPKNSKHSLKRKTIGGRTAIYCPIDQK